MLAVTVNFSIAPGKMANFLPLMHANAQASLTSEPGCLQFDVCVDDDLPDTVFLYEIYIDEAAFTAHLASAHYAVFDAATRDMITDKHVSKFREVTR